MNIVVDTSSTINLYNGGMLEIVLGLTSLSYVFHMGVIVKGECGDLSGVLNLYVTDGRLILLPDQTLLLSEFTAVLEEYDLGAGETECIALARQQGLTVCTDDKAARRAATSYLGANRVLGSLALIRECVRSGRLSPSDAIIGYRTMRLCGAFLPDLEASYFDC